MKPGNRYLEFVDARNIILHLSIKSKMVLNPTVVQWQLADEVRRRNLSASSYEEAFFIAKPYTLKMKLFPTVQENRNRRNIQSEKKTFYF